MRPVEYEQQTSGRPIRNNGQGSCRDTGLAGTCSVKKCAEFLVSSELCPTLEAGSPGSPQGTGRSAFRSAAVLGTSLEGWGPPREPRQPQRPTAGAPAKSRRKVHPVSAPGQPRKNSCFEIYRVSLHWSHAIEQCSSSFATSPHSRVHTPGDATTCRPTLVAVYTVFNGICPQDLLR